MLYTTYHEALDRILISEPGLVWARGSLELLSK